MQKNLYDDPIFFENYMQLRENPLNYNRLLEQPALQAMLPPLRGKSVLDLDCGFGDACRAYLTLGAAEVTGIDLSHRMIAEAEKRNADARIVYHCMDMTALSALDKMFDVAVSSLAVHYIEDFDAFLCAVRACLQPGGVFVFSQEHPLTTAPSAGPQWMATEAGARYYALSGYSRPGARTVPWLDRSVQKYHRTFSQILCAARRAGFTLEEMQEPVPNAETVRKNPRMEKEFDKPSFLLLRLRAGAV